MEHLPFAYMAPLLPDDGRFKGVDVTLINEPCGEIIIKVQIDVTDKDGTNDETANLSLILDRATQCRGKVELLPLIRTSIATVCLEELSFMTVDDIGEVQTQTVDLLESFLPR